MNNFYVDEMPKDCWNCLYCFGCEEDGYYCDLDVFHREYDFDGRHPNCPLKSINDRLAEERKKVVQEIRENFKENYFLVPNTLGCIVGINREEFAEFLDQIERGGL